MYFVIKMFSTLNRIFGYVLHCVEAESRQGLDGMDTTLYTYLECMLSQIRMYVGRIGQPSFKLLLRAVGAYRGL